MGLHRLEVQVVTFWSLVLVSSSVLHVEVNAVVMIALRVTAVVVVIAVVVIALRYCALT